MNDLILRIHFRICSFLERAPKQRYAKEEFDRMQGRADKFTREKKVVDADIQPGFFFKLPHKARRGRFPKFNTSAWRRPEIGFGKKFVIYHQQLMIMHAYSADPQPNSVSIGFMNGIDHFSVEGYKSTRKEINRIECRY